MKKFLIFFCIPLILLMTGCQKDTEDYSSQVKMEVEHITSAEGNKTIDITYPMVGGLADSRSLATINNSITNYVEMQEKEFNNALSESTENTPIVEDFDATVTQQIETDTTEETVQYYDEDGNLIDADGNLIEESTDTENTEEAATEEENTEETTTDTEATEEDAGATENTEDSATASTTPISLTMHFDITYHKNNILNIVMTYEKVLGKDKIYIGKQSFVFDLEKGLPIAIDELYDFNGDFPTTVNDAINQQIAESGMQLYDDNSGFSGIRKDANFYLDQSDDSLYIFYSALEISPEKELMPTFQFSLNKLSPYLTETYGKTF